MNGIKTLMVVLCLVVVLSSTNSTALAKTLVATSQVYAEPQILVEMVKHLIEAHTDLKVEHKRNFQGTNLVHAAFVSRNVDFYVSHTGTQFTGVLNMEVTDEWKDRDKVLRYVQNEFQEQFDATWFEPFGFNNTYALVLRNDTIDELGLKTMEDLVEHAPRLRIAVDQTFMARIGDGFYDMAHYYGYKFKQAVSMDYGLMYRAVDSKDVDVAVAYSTDGRISALDLGILEDNKEFFPPYDCSLIMHNDVLEEYPILEEILQPLLGAIDEDTMQTLNKQVDVDGLDPADVAHEYLKGQGLL